MTAAQNVHESAKEDAAAVSSRLDEAETADLAQGWGVQPGVRAKAPRGYLGAASELKEDQKRRARRVVTDSIDGALLELLSFYRDVLVLQSGAASILVNEEMRSAIVAVASRGGAEQTLRRIEAIGGCREALTSNAAPLLALESLMLSLRL